MSITISYASDLNNTIQSLTEESIKREQSETPEPIEQNTFSINHVMHPTNLQMIWDQSIKKHEQQCASSPMACHYSFLLKIPKVLLGIINDYGQNYWRVCSQLFTENFFLKMHPDETDALQKFLEKVQSLKNQSSEHQLLAESILMRGILHFFLDFSKSYWNECLNQCDDEHLTQSESYQSWIAHETAAPVLEETFQSQSIIKIINDYITPKFRDHTRAFAYCSSSQFDIMNRLISAKVISKTEFIKGTHAYFKRIAIRINTAAIFMPIRYRCRRGWGEKLKFNVSAIITLDSNRHHFNPDQYDFSWVIHNRVDQNQSTPQIPEKGEFYLLHNKSIFFIQLEQAEKETAIYNYLKTDPTCTIWDIDSDTAKELKKKKLTKNALLVAQYSNSNVIDIP